MSVQVEQVERITVLVGPDGVARIEAPDEVQKVVAGDIDGVRARVVQYGRDRAERTDTHQQLVIDDPDGTYTVYVSPTRQVAETLEALQESETEPAAEQAEVAGEDGELFGAVSKSVECPAPTGVRAVELSARLADTEAVLGKPETKHQPRRTNGLSDRMWVLLAGAGLLGVGICVAGAVYAAPLFTQVTKQEAPVPVSSGMTDPTWEKQAAWNVDVSPQTITVSSDGEVFGYVDGGRAVVRETATGKTLAKVQLGEGAGTRIYRAGSLLVALTTTTAHIYDSQAAGDSWQAVALNGAAVRVRGDALLLERSPSTYELVNNDGKAAPIPVPTVGAVPVGATADTVLWAADGETVETDRAGRVQKRTKIGAPVPGALPSWLGVADGHALIAWTVNGTATLTLTDTLTGKQLASRPLSAIPARSGEWTTNGQCAVLGDLLIDTTTNQPTIHDAPGARTVGIAVMTGDELNCVGGPRSITDTKTRILAITQAGIISEREGQLVFAPTTTEKGKQP
jgi:hypothetical protein